MDGDKAVRPERNAAFIQPLFHLLARRFEDSGPCDHHLKFPFDPAQAGQNALAHFADQLDGKAASLAFGGDAVLAKPGRTKLAGQRRRTGAVADDFDFFLGLGMLSALIWYFLTLEFRSRGFWIGFVLFIIISTIGVYTL